VVRARSYGVQRGLKCDFFTSFDTYALVFIPQEDPFQGLKTVRNSKIGRVDCRFRGEIESRPESCSLLEICWTLDDWTSRNLEPVQTMACALLL
jgi:hypothetical protein